MQIIYPRKKLVKVEKLNHENISSLDIYTSFEIISYLSKNNKIKKKYKLISC